MVNLWVEIHGLGELDARHRHQHARVVGRKLGSFADHIEDAVSIPYGDIPNFASSTVIGHRGELVCGRAGGVRGYGAYLR